MLLRFFIPFPLSFFLSLDFDDEVMELCKMGQSCQGECIGDVCQLLIVYCLLCGIYTGYDTARGSLALDRGTLYMSRYGSLFLRKYDIRVLDNTSQAFYDNTNSSMRVSLYRAKYAQKCQPNGYQHPTINTNEQNPSNHPPHPLSSPNHANLTLTTSNSPM